MKRVIIVLCALLTMLAVSCEARRDYNEWLTVVVNSTPDSSHLQPGMLWGNSHVKLIGTINASDFDTLRSVTTIFHLDLSEVKVVGRITVVPASATASAITQIDNAIPAGAFGLTTRFNPITNDNKTLEAHQNLRSIIFPKMISSIGSNAFAYCGLNRELALPASLLHIYDSAFNCCGYLSGTLTLPQALVTLGGYAFNQCPNLTGSVTLPQGLDSIAAHTFSNCSSISEVVLPKRLRRIGRFAFAATSIAQIDLPSTLEQVDQGAFRNCRKLIGSLDLPSALHIIGRSAFDSTAIDQIKLNWLTTNILPRWDTSQHWFPDRFETSKNAPQYKLLTPQGTLNLIKQLFRFDEKTYYNIAEIQ